MANQLRQSAAEKETLAKVYSWVFETCSSGRHNLLCVSQAQFAQSPGPWLRECNERNGPQPTASAAVCQYAKEVLDVVVPRSQSYSELARLLTDATAACESIPLPCIVQVEQCVGARDIRYCWHTCMKTGNMNHALPGGRPCPSTTTTITTKTTTTTVTVATSSTYYWQAAVEAVEGVINTDLDGVGHLATTTTTTVTTTRGGQMGR